MEIISSPSACFPIPISLYPHLVQFKYAHTWPLVIVMLHFSPISPHCPAVNMCMWVDSACYTLSANVFAAYVNTCELACAVEFDIHHSCIIVVEVIFAGTAWVATFVAADWSF